MRLSWLIFPDLRPSASLIRSIWGLPSGVLSNVLIQPYEFSVFVGHLNSIEFLEAATVFNAFV